jgi:chromosome segregation ATPase
MDKGPGIMTRKAITGASGKAEEGRPYLTHLNDLMAAVEAKRDEAKRASADLQVEIDELHKGIERRNTDTARDNDHATTMIQAKQDEMDDYNNVVDAAEAAMMKARGTV